LRRLQQAFEAILGVVDETRALRAGLPSIIGSAIPRSRRTASSLTITPWHLWPSSMDRSSAWDRWERMTWRRNRTFVGDIREIEALTNSKSELSEYPTLDDFALARCQMFIADCSLDALRENLRHHEIRILGEEPSDRLVRFGCDGKVCLVNAGGSHHFAAARYIAGQLDERVAVRAQLKEYGLNEPGPVLRRRDPACAVGRNRNFHPYPFCCRHFQLLSRGLRARDLRTVIRPACNLRTRGERRHRPLLPLERVLRASLRATLERVCHDAPHTVIIERPWASCCHLRLRTKMLRCAVSLRSSAPMSMTV